MRKSTTENL